MAINKFKRSRLTLELRWHILESHQYIKNIVFSQTIGPIELKFHMKTPYDRLAKIYTKCTGHITKMATRPIYGKNPLNVFYSETKRPMALRLGM